MRKFCVVSAIVLLCIIYPSLSHSAQYWAKTYGGSDADYATSIQPTTDGGFFLVGGTNSFTPPGHGLWVIKLESNGNIAWEKSFESMDFGNSVNIYQYNTSEDTNNNFKYSAQQTTDGGYIIAGSDFYSSVALRDVILIIRLEEDGDVIWQKYYYVGCEDYIYSIQQTTDGGYIAVGYSNRTCDNLSDIWILKLDNNGDLLWQKTYPIYLLFSGEAVGSFQQTSDGGYIVASSIGFEGTGTAVVMKLANDGEVIWQKTYSGSGEDYINSIKQTLDGGYIVVGSTYSSAWILKLNDNGEILWQKTYSGIETYQARSIYQNSDGGYIVVGNSFLMRLDNTGNVLWQKINEDYLGFGNSISPTSDGEGYVFVGNNTVPWSDRDIVVMKVSNNGEIPSCDLIDTDDVVVSDTSIMAVGFNITSYTTLGYIYDSNILPIDTFAAVTTICTWIDSDDDSIPDDEDNCPYHPNGSFLGTCIIGNVRQTCTDHEDCGEIIGFCSMNQADDYPSSGNGIGDACDCEGNFDCIDQDVDGTDAATFKLHFGRNQQNNPCNTLNPCYGDFDCDEDCDGTDAAIFKEDFGRSTYINPCPACVVGEWCVYE